MHWPTDALGARGVRPRADNGDSQQPEPKGEETVTKTTKPRTPRTKKLAPSIKGFDRNMQCRGFQFEDGKTYEHEGPITVCRTGFHAISADAHPLSVFDYYPPAGSLYREVVQAGETATDDNIKLASAKITIGCEISISDLTKRAIEWVFARAKKSEGSTATGVRGAASATGEYGSISDRRIWQHQRPANMAQHQRPAIRAQHQRPANMAQHQRRLSGRSISDRLSGRSISDRLSGRSISDRLSGRSISDRLSGRSISDRRSWRSISDRRSWRSISDRLSGRSISDRRIWRSISDRLSGRSISDRRIWRSNGQWAFWHRQRRRWQRTVRC
jgi:hypothetical protein